MAAPQASSRLEMLQARFQQRQLLEKEQKLLQLYDQQQLRAHQVAQRGSAGSNGSNSPGNGTSSTVTHHQTVTRTTTSTHSNSNSPAGGKVRQMFDERRQTTVKGIDKSYPLEPLDNRSRKQTTTTTSNVVTTSTSPLKNGNPMSNRQSLVVRRTVRSEANSNVNGGKPIVSYHEEVSRESCGPTERDNEPDEFGDDDNREYANGNRQIDERSEVQIEDVTNENTAQRHRVTAKIHIGEYDESNRVADDLENEQFPENFVMDDRLPRRATPPKKPSQAEARLERFKNSNPKRPGQIAKAGNTTSYTKKRTETSVNSGSTSRASTVTRTELEEDEDEETSRIRSKSPTPEVERTGSSGGPKSPTSEERSRKLTFPVVDRSSIIVARSSGVSKVSQLTHKNSLDFYPRRKSEFEKSKTFRKLQLELGVSSPEPEEEIPVRSVKQCKKRSSILVDDLYSPGGRRSSSSSPTTDPEGRKKSESPVNVGKTSETTEAKTSSSIEYISRRKSSTSSLTDRNTFEERRTSREMSPERPTSRKLSESPINPVYERKSTVKREEKISADGKRHSTTVESNLSSRRQSSSTRATDATKGRKVSREMTPERPQSRRGSESPVHGRKSSLRSEENKTTSGRIKTTGHVSSIYSSQRRSSSSSPASGRDPETKRRCSREMTPERPQSRRGSESPVHGRKSSLRSEENKTTSGRIKTTGHVSSIYSSQRRSSSSSPASGRDPETKRRCSREMTPERPQSRRGSESPVHGRKSSLRSEENKTTSDRMKTTGHVSSIYSSQRRSSSSSPASGRDPETNRRCSREMTPERPQSRRGSESPVHGRKSSLRSEENKMTSGRIKTTGHVSSIYSSQRRSSSSSPASGRDPETKRRCSREMTPERPQSRRGSESPIYERRSSLRNEETITITEIKTGRESDVYLSRRRSSSASPTFHDLPQGREMTPERPQSRRGSESPICRRRSIDEETRSTRKRSESPRREFQRPSVDLEDSRVKVDNRRSSGTLRSIELVKKVSRPEKKATTSTRKSLEMKTTLEDVDFARPTSRSKSPVRHRVVKKDKAVLENKSKVINETRRKNSNESKSGTKVSRSRTVSPSPPPSGSMRETASSRAKKAERKDSAETRSELRHHLEERKGHEINKTNLSHEKARNCDLTNVVRSSSPEDKSASQSRRSSADVTVKRHDTFKVKKPSERVINVERETSVDDDDELPIGKPIAKDPSELLERIEKIRTTLSKTGRSEQNLHESKDFERTDSVESALRRFDSIGVETEHHVTVGADEIDRKSASPEPIRRSKEIGKEGKGTKKSVDPRSKTGKMVDEIDRKSATPEPIRRSKEIGKEGRATKKSVDTRSKSGKITVAVAKVQPKKIEPKSQKAAMTKSVRAKEKSATKSSQKIATSLVERSKLRGEESSGRGEGRLTDRSPECKRRLFDDSESEIDTDQSRSTVVMTTMTTVTKSPGFVEIEARNNRENRMIGNDRSESIVRAEQEPTKILRSIEDIRKSIRRESQDFKRELNKFNTVMRRDEEMTSSVSSSTPDAIVTSGIVSCVKITKTQGPDDVEPVVKLERSTVKLPITRHRVAKSPSPDIGTRRATDGRARTPTASVRRSVPSSPAKSPDAAARYGSADIRSAGPRPSTRSSASPSSARITEDCTDGPGDYSELTITETTTRRNDAFVVELDDDDVPRGKENASSGQGKPPLRKQSTEKSLTSQKTQRSPNATPLPRPASALSTSSTGSARGQSSQINSKTRMSTKTKTPAPNAPKRPSDGARASTAAPVNDGLAPCKICGRRFNSDRITLHEQICSKTATKKRKQFDATIHRVKGTELESFVVKKGAGKKGAADRKTSKPEVKSNWRRKHEDFINAIRSAKQMQAHLAAGGKLSDLPPPPPSDTSDYIQCPHCGRKFNQGAAERHIPKCQNMMHNKPNPRAPPKPKR